MYRYIVILISFVASLYSVSNSENVIRVNQVGYLEDDVKVAVMLISNQVDSTMLSDISQFTITNVNTGETKNVDYVKITDAWAPMEISLRIDFSSITTPGEYYITALGTRSPKIKIGNDVYDGAQEIPLFYMRQQRCGYNPSLKSFAINMMEYLC